MALFKQNCSIFLMKFELGNFSLPFIFHFPFPSLWSDYNTEKHSPGFHSCLPSWPDELGKDKTFVNGPGPAVGSGGALGFQHVGWFSQAQSKPIYFLPSQWLCWALLVHWHQRVRQVCDFLTFLLLRKLFLSFQTFSSAPAPHKPFQRELK